MHIVDLLGLLLTTPTQVQAHLVATRYRVECDLMVTIHLVVALPGHGLCIGSQHGVIIFIFVDFFIKTLYQSFFFQDVAMEQGGVAFVSVLSSLLQISTSDISLLE